MRDLVRAVTELSISNPALLAILAGDVVAGDPFNPPPVVGAAAGRGRRRALPGGEDDADRGAGAAARRGRNDRSEDVRRRLRC